MQNEVEHPAHRVTISEDFWMGQFPVTQRQWQEVMGTNPSYFRNAGPDAPVEQLSWKDVQAFLAKVGPMDGPIAYRGRMGICGQSWEYGGNLPTAG